MSNLTTISAEVILDSLLDNERVVTFKLYSPVFIDAEIEKHGNLATNTSSARAIGYPFTKLQGNDPFIPTRFTKATNTMHGDSFVDDAVADDLEHVLTELFEHIQDKLEPFKSIVHKQHLNRYLSPFALQTKIMTANYDAIVAFINARIKQADPSITELSRCMMRALIESESVIRSEHLPFVSDVEGSDDMGLTELGKILWSAGAVAKVSYHHQIEIESPRQSITRANQLVELNHKSPFEHQIFAATHRFDKDTIPNSTWNGWTHSNNSGIRFSGRMRECIQARKLFWSGLLTDR